MSLYNLIHGVNQSTFYILPMLGMHPENIPRFRDCFVEDRTIIVLTRVGGSNRNCGYGQEKLYEHPNFIKTYDSEEDSTYGFYVFSIPEEWEDDFDKLLRGERPSEKYIDQMCKVYPKLETKFRDFFKQE